MANAPTQQQIMQQNFMARQNLLTTGIAMTKRLSPVTGELGSMVKIPLLRMGVMTSVVLHFTVPVNIATAAAVPSAVSPYNIAQQVVYNDFAGVQRTRTNGFQLWMAQSFKQGDALSTIPAHTGSGAPTLNYDTNILRLPTAVGAGEIKFSLVVPMAYDPNSDLTGAVMTQTNVGEHYITVQLANLLQGADPWIAPYLAGASAVTSGGNVTIEAFQNYIQPQNMSIENLPMLDLSTIYGFEGNYQLGANINSNQATFINYPNNRSILSTLITFENSSAFTLDGTDLSQITVIANSNTNFKEMSPRLVREMMRNMLNADAPNGTYYLPSRRQPIMTQLYANVQAKMDVQTVNAGGVTQMVSQFEVQYPSGAPLPGITVAA